ncbi:MAG: hypothetical protein ACLR3S_01080 [Clostridium fessum]
MATAKRARQLIAGDEALVVRMEETAFDRDRRAVPF